MTQLAILSGIYARETPDLARSVPVNLIPVAQPGDGSGTGISKGYLRLAHGVTQVHESALDRGGYVFEGKHLRVLGSQLVSVTRDAVTVIGSVGDAPTPVTFAEGFGRLAIASAGDLYYLAAGVLSKVTDTDLGTALSVAWSDGYFITTDGTSIVVTELNDPTKVDPLKYGSSEADPDPIVAVTALRGEVFALNRYSIEKFLNSGSTGFPFSRSRGSQIPKGCVGPHAFVPFVETLAFCGSARNETVSVYLAGAGQAIRISPQELDAEMATLTDAQIAAIELETMQAGGLNQLLVHLPGGTWIYHWSASQLLDVPVWSRVTSGPNADQAYRPRHFTLFGPDWWCGSATALGIVDPASPSVFGEATTFRFDTPLPYNEGNGVIVNSLELVPLDGRGSVTGVSMSYTDDGRTWSVQRFVRSGTIGERGNRMQWRRLGKFRRWRGFRFRGIAGAPIAFTRLDVELEPLNG